MKPFIRCAGGKRKLAPTILSLMPPPDVYDTYIEPFAGGAAVLFALRAAHRLDETLVVLGDADPDLAALYVAVRDDATALAGAVDALVVEAQRDPEQHFLAQRHLWNKHEHTPARHLYLRRGAWNGLWRCSKNGNFNAPWRKEAPKPIGESLRTSGVALHGVEVLDWDFRRYESEMHIGDRTLVYLDPPYLGAPGAFKGYRPEGWTTKDFTDLLDLCRIWSGRGAHIVLSHADTPEARAALAERWPAAVLHEIQAARAINSDGTKRGPVPELIVVGHPVDTRHVTPYAVGDEAPRIQ